MKSIRLFFFAMLLLSVAIPITAGNESESHAERMGIQCTVTPYSVLLSWEKAEKGPFEVVIASDPQMKKVVLRKNDFQGSEFRAALCPDQAYWCVVSRQGETTGGKVHFTTPRVENKFDATVLEKYEAARPKYVYAVDFFEITQANMLPVDESLPVSPWYGIKEYYGETPPKFSTIADKLPIPILDGEENQPLLDSYWYAWSVAFDEWLFESKDKSQVVTNLCGYPNWGPFGSTMDYDTFFIMQFARYANGAYPYYTVLDNLYARQHHNGRIHKETSALGYEVYSSSPTLPSALAWTEWECYLISGDKDRLDKILLPLVKLYEWFQTYQRDEDGLYYNEQHGHGDMSVSSNAFQMMNAKALSDMAGVVGRKDLQAYFLQEWKEMSTIMNDWFWDDASAFYNLLNPDGTYNTHITPSETFKFTRSFDALLANAATQEQADRMFDRHVLNPDVFRGKYGIRSLSLDSTSYLLDKGRFVSLDSSAFNFQRTVWAPTMVSAVKGLYHYGRYQDAFELGEDYARGIAKGYQETGDIPEYSYADETTLGGAPRFCGWSGYGPIACLIEAVLGFEVDAPNKTVYWDIHQTARHGIEQLHFGGMTANFLCDARTSLSDPCHITVITDKPFTLMLRENGKVTKTYEIQEGTSHLTR